MNSMTSSICREGYTPQWDGRTSKKSATLNALPEACIFSIFSDYLGFFTKENSEEQYMNPEIKNIICINKEVKRIITDPFKLTTCFQRKITLNTKLSLNLFLIFAKAMRTKHPSLDLKFSFTNHLFRSKTNRLEIYSDEGIQLLNILSPIRHKIERLSFIEVHINWTMQEVLTSKFPDVKLSFFKAEVEDIDTLFHMSEVLGISCENTPQPQHPIIFIDEPIPEEDLM